MSRLVEDVMDATRWAHGRMVIRRQRIDLRDTIAVAVLDVAAAMAERGHEFFAVVDAEPIWVDGDAQRLQQVLSNLLRNAAKYTPIGGRISIETSSAVLLASVRVRDNGIGIDPASLPHVFDLFSQFQPASAPGLGIGLSIVREIVALHDGDITAHSDGPGLGSEFVVSLPLASPPPHRRNTD
jgi:signal transduction histidine kinase